MEHNHQPHFAESSLCWFSYRFARTDVVCSEGVFVCKHYPIQSQTFLGGPINSHFSLHSRAHHQPYQPVRAITFISNSLSNSFLDNLLFSGKGFSFPVLWELFTGCFLSTSTEICRHFPNLDLSFFSDYKTRFDNICWSRICDNFWTMLLFFFPPEKSLLAFHFGPQVSSLLCFFVSPSWMRLLIELRN